MRENDAADDDEYIEDADFKEAEVKEVRNGTEHGRAPGLVDVS